MDQFKLLHRDVIEVHYTLFKHKEYKNIKNLNPLKHYKTITKT